MRHHPRPWLAGSSFTTGRRRPLCREARRIWRARLESARRGGHITALHKEVGLAMLRRLGEDGRLDPSHATVATEAGCCDRTVRRALDRLRGLGLLGWDKRLVRAGWRVEQTSNAYQLTPEGPPIPAKSPRQSTGGQVGRETPSKFISTVPAQASVAEQLAAFEALGRIAADQQARFVAAWQAGRGSRG
jgi:hypothetical protein